MDINKLKTIYEQLVSKIESKPETAFPFLNSEWANLTYAEKEVLRLFIDRYHDIVFKENKLNLENQFYLTEIFVIFEMEIEGEFSTGKLLLSPNIKDIQIAKLFYELKNRSHILNTSEELAGVIAKVFDRKFKTILSYLNNPEKMTKAVPLM
jgi:hypothetical protein